MNLVDILRGCRSLDQAISDGDVEAAWSSRLAVSRLLRETEPAEIAILGALRLSVAQHWWVTRLAWDSKVRSVIYGDKSARLAAEISDLSREQHDAPVSVGSLLAWTALLTPQALPEVLDVLTIPAPVRLTSLRQQLALAHAMAELDGGTGSLEAVSQSRSELLRASRSSQLGEFSLALLDDLLANGSYVDILRRSTPEESAFASDLIGRMVDGKEAKPDRYAAALHLELVGPTFLTQSATTWLLQCKPWRARLLRSIMPQIRIFWTKQQAQSWDRFSQGLLSAVLELRTDLPTAEWMEIAATVLRSIKVGALYGQQTSMKGLQAARGALLGRYVRDGHPELLYAPVRPRLPSVGVVIAHTDETTENLTALAYMHAFAAARWDVKLFIVPHSRGPENRGALYQSFAAAAESIEYFAGDPNATVDEIRSRSVSVALFLHNVTWGISDYIEVAAMRVAPAQATTYVATVTTGLSSMDAYVSGIASERPDDPQGNYTEKLILKHGSAICFPGRVLEASTSRGIDAAPGTRVFISGANFYKLNEDLLTTWMRLLSAVPDSVLRLYPFNPNWDQSYPRKALTVWLSEVAGREGVSSDRIEIVGPWPTRSEMLETLTGADVYLDSFPHSGGLSTIDPLLAGLPVVTLRGLFQRSTQGADVLVALGRADWIVGTDEEYVQTAARLMHERPRIGSTELESLRESPLMNEHRFASEMAPVVDELLLLSQSRTDTMIAHALAARHRNTLSSTADATNRTTIRDGEWRYEEGFSYEESAPSIGLAKPFRWSEGPAVSLTIDSSSGGARTLLLKLRSVLQGQSMIILFNGKRLGVTDPLSGYLDAPEIIAVAIDAAVGANVIELLLGRTHSDSSGREIGIIIEDVNFDETRSASILQPA